MGQAWIIISGIFTVLGGLVAIPQAIEYIKRWGAGIQRASNSGSTVTTAQVQYGYKRPSSSGKALAAGFPWALAFAMLGEYLLVAVAHLSDTSGPYYIFILLCWAAGLPIGIIARNRSSKFVKLVAGAGCLAVILILISTWSYF